MKYLLVLIVVLVGAWLLFGRRGKTAAPPNSPSNTATQMVACAHCGLHLPQDDAVLDAAQRAYCGEPHRLAGPR